MANFDRIAMVDVQPHYFSGVIDRVDLVIDHHPEQTGYSAVFKDIRPDYGSTSTILTEHLRAVDANISERTATAMLYAIKSDTLFFNRQANRVDLEAFSYLYPLADAALIRKMEGAEITMERLEYVLKAKQNGQHGRAGVLRVPRQRRRARTSSPTSPTSTCSSRTSSGRSSSGIVNDSLVMSVRNLGYSRNAGEFVRKYFATSAAPAATARWPRPSCRCARSAISSATCRPTSSPRRSSRSRSSSSTSTRRPKRTSWSRRRVGLQAPGFGAAGLSGRTRDDVRGRPPFVSRGSLGPDS